MRREDPTSGVSPALGMGAIDVDDVVPVEVGPGCFRRDLPSSEGLRVWVVDMDPGARWPHTDHHDAGEELLVLRGELIEGERHFGPGSYLHFGPGSSHRPYSRKGVRLFGMNVTGKRP